MEQSSKQGYFLQWLIGVGDLIILNALFFGIYYALEPVYTQPIAHSFKEVILLLNFCYFFALYFVPIKIHLSIVFLDNVVQRSFTLVTFQTFLFCTC